jgi:tetratricopeptide (TPR) repeat protein
MFYKKQYHQAIQLFEKIYVANKTEVIADATLLRLGMIAEATNDALKAIGYYQLIISDFEDSIYRDEALFFSGELYHKKLDQPNQAMALYERIIFEHPDSIHFVEARKKYRQLRGDNSL